MLFLEDCEAMRCGSCGKDADCDEDVAFHGRCHPTSPTWAWYIKGKGVIRIVCAKCEQIITEIAIAVRCEGEDGSKDPHT